LRLPHTQQRDCNTRLLFSANCPKAALGLLPLRASVRAASAVSKKLV
jgi:hypothetical protein